MLSPSTAVTPTDHSSVFLDAPKWLRDHFQVTGAAQVERARTFIESSSPVVLPQPSPVRFQQTSIGMACCAGEASRHERTSDSVQTFAFCDQHLTIAAREDGVATLGALGSPLALEKTLVHEWTHAAQHRTYPNYFSQFQALRGAQDELFARLKTKATEISTLPFKERMRESQHLFDLMAEMKNN